MIGFSRLNFLCISRVSRLMAGWKYVCSASTISLTPFSKACCSGTQAVVRGLLDVENILNILNIHNVKTANKGLARICGVILTFAKMSTLCSILFICLSSSAVNFFSKGSSWPV